MLQIADGETGHAAVVVSVSCAAGQIFYRPSRAVVIDLVDLGTWRVENVNLLVGRGGEGDETTPAFFVDFIDPPKNLQYPFTVDSPISLTLDFCAVHSDLS